MIEIKHIHHAAIIASDYQKSKGFYTETLGFKIVAETYRPDKKSWKLDLEVGGRYQIELFSFPDPPKRVSRPEAAGLRHLAFAVEDVDYSAQQLRDQGVDIDSGSLVDEITGKRFIFFRDPDQLPLELYQIDEETK